MPGLILGGNALLLGGTAISSLPISGDVGGFRTGEVVSHTSVTQWTRDGVNISGATADDYTLIVADEYATIDSDGTGSAIFARPALAAASVTATIGGASKIGDYLYTSIPALGGYPKGRLSYQWQFDGTPESGATEPDHLVVSGDSAKVPSVIVSAANTTATTSSTPVAASVAAADVYGVSAYGDADPSLAVNINGINDWSVEMPFIDIFKQSREFLGDYATQDHDYLVANNHLDASGWPISIPPSGQIITIYDWNEQPEHNAYMAATTWQLAWNGTGTVSVSGTTTTDSSTANSIDFTVNDGGAAGPIISISISATNASPTNVRNFTLIRTDRQALYDAGEIFNPDFIDFVRDFRLLRFMDWGVTNDSPQTTWASRASPDAVTFSTVEGSPLEFMVSVCNRAKTDMWLCIPHQAVDDWVTQAAAYVREYLDPQLVCHVEYSNETWNGIFGQGAYCLAEGRTDWPGASGEADTTVMLSWYGKRSKECFDLWDAEWVGAEARRKRVLGTQTDNSWIAEQVADAPIWQTYDIGTYAAPYLSSDHIACTTYFGYDVLQDAGRRGVLAAAYPSTSDQVIYDYLTDPSNGLATVPELRSDLIASSLVAVARGLTLVCYEGGAHILHTSSGDIDGSDSELAVIQFMDSDQCAEINQIIWDIWKDDVASAGPFMQFSTIGLWGHHGAWSMIQAYGDVVKFSDQLRSLSKASGNWWGGTGDYRQGGAKVNDVRLYAYQNSLWHYAGGGGPGNDDETVVPNWVDRFCDADVTAANTLLGEGEFGFFNQWQSPPQGGQHWNDVAATAPGTYGTWAAVDDNNANQVVFVPDNFQGPIYGPPTQNHPGFDDKNYVDELGRLIDAWEANTDDVVRYRIFEGWRDGFPDISPFPSDAAGYADWLTSNGAGTSYDIWYIDLITELQVGRTDLDIQLIPSARVVVAALQNTPLSALGQSDLFVDASPHGNETAYCLAGMVTYTFMYEKECPMSFAFDGGWGVNATLTSNYKEIAGYIYGELFG